MLLSRCYMMIYLRKKSIFYKLCMLATTVLKENNDLKNYKNACEVLNDFLDGCIPM